MSDSSGKQQPEVVHIADVSEVGTFKDTLELTCKQQISAKTEKHCFELSLLLCMFLLLLTFSTFTTTVYCSVTNTVYFTVTTTVHCTFTTSVH